MAVLSKAGKGESATKEDISKLRQKLSGLQHDFSRVNQLLEMARPAKIPDFKPRTTSSSADGSVTTTTATSTANKFAGIMVGKRRGGGIATQLRKIDPAMKKESTVAALSSTTTAAAMAAAAKLLADDEDDKPKHRSLPKLDDDDAVDLEKRLEVTPSLPAASPSPTAPSSKPERFKMSAPIQKPPRRPAPPRRVDDDDRSGRNEKHYEEEVWVPPSNQSGDGRTSLNDKYGY